MKKWYSLLIGLTALLFTACSEEESNLEADEYSTASEVVIPYEKSLLNGYDAFSSDSLIIKLREYNQEFDSTLGIVQSRDYTDTSNAIKVGLADAHGAAVGFSQGGWLGAVIGALMYSIAAVIQLYYESLMGEVGTSSVLQKPKIECVCSNALNNTQLYDLVVEEADDVTFELPANFIKEYQVGIIHNMLLHLYSDDFYPSLQSLPLDDNWTDALSSVDKYYAYFVNNADEELGKLPRDYSMAMPQTGYERGREIVSLFFEIINKAREMRTVNEISAEYIEMIETDNSLSDDEKKFVYSTISTGVFSISFWIKNIDSYAITSAAGDSAH